MGVAMERVTLRRAGGSLVLTIPRAHASTLGLSEGERMLVSIADGKLIAAPHVAAPPRYQMDELLAQCDAQAPLTREDAEWLAAKPVGEEFN
jgi:antitoxin ChpS